MIREIGTFSVKIRVVFLFMWVAIVAVASLALLDLQRESKVILDDLALEQSTLARSLSIALKERISTIAARLLNQATSPWHDPKKFLRKKKVCSFLM